MKTNSLQGKVVMITGGVSGIGLAVAEEMLSRGAVVAMADIRTTPESDALQSRYAGKASFVQMDVSNPEKVKSAIDSVAAAHGGRIDAMISNAGIQIQRPFEDQTPETFQKLIGINLMGKVYGAMFALPYMKANGGYIINTSSVHGHVGSDQRGPYCAAMHGTIGFTRSLAADVAKYGIRVYSVSPAFIDTPLARGPLHDLIAKGRFANMEEAEKWRLQYQGNEWVAMDDVVHAYVDVIDGTVTIPTGADINTATLSKGYIESANRNGGMAIFEPDTQQAVDRMNTRTQSAA